MTTTEAGALSAEQLHVGRPGRGRLAALGAAAVAFAILIGLGVWQLQRLAWKTALIRQVEALQSAEARPLAPVLTRSADAGSAEFTRVWTTCPELERTPTLRLYALREQMGYRLITACPVRAGPYRSILVDRGFILREAVSHVEAGADRGETAVVGVLRRGDAPGPFTPAHTGPGADWYGRNIPAMAAELGALAPAPVFLMLERPAPSGFGPTPSALPAEIRNPHLGYALTWFGLAAALLGVCWAAFRRQPRER